MNLRRKISVLIFTCFLVGLWNHARAAFPTTSLASGNSISYDGLQFTVSSCSFSLNGVGQSSCTLANDTLEIVASNRGSPTIELIGNGSGYIGNDGTVSKGSAALACYDCTGASQIQLTLTLTHASGEPSPTVTTYSNAITGSPTSSASVTSNATWSSYSAAVSLASPTASTGTFTNVLPTSMPVVWTLGLASNASSTLTLATDALHFSPAPEPASLGLLTVGTCAVAAVRRRRSRRERP